MTIRLPGLLLASTLALAARPALAVEIAVSYLAEARALTAGATADTVLTMELHTDSACTAAVHSTVVPISELVMIERIKTIRIRGMDPAPRAVRLHHVLHPAIVEPTLYLAVTGPGITPVGRPCQHQLSVPLQVATLPCATAAGTDVVFEGCNVHVRSGSGSTAGALNGLGNLIVGYNEAPDGGTDRSGSHNLIIGQEHGYGSYGGLVAGFSNTVSARNAAVTGGAFNHAAWPQSSICGGAQGVTMGFASTVSGGNGNRTEADFAAVGGGALNVASGFQSTVSGGAWNVASGGDSWIAGGSFNRATGPGTSIAGGNSNAASGVEATVSGGGQNEASGGLASVSGGTFNTAAGVNSSISGGSGRSVHGADDWAAGSLFED